MVISVISHCVIICFSGIPAPCLGFSSPAGQRSTAKPRSIALLGMERNGWWVSSMQHTYNVSTLCTYMYVYFRSLYIYMLHIQCIHHISYTYFAHINHEKTSTKLYARLGSSQDAPDTIHRSGRIGLDFSLSLRTSWFNQFNQQELHSCPVGS